MVTVLRDAGRDAEAERWARRGLAEDPASYWADELREQLGVAIYSVKCSLSCRRLACSWPGQLVRGYLLLRC
jgi:hypothetical protein